MSKHAPVKWSFNEDDWGVADQEGSQIARVYEPEDFPCFNAEEFGQEETIRLRSACADWGRLIAAAPELLEALRAYVAAVNVHYWERHEPTIEGLGVKAKQLIERLRGAEVKDGEIPNI